jgi:hypothetical protein
MSRCVVMKGGIHIQTYKLMGGIYEVRHLKVASVIQKLIGWVHRHIQHRDRIKLLLFYFIFFLSRLKIESKDVCVAPYWPSCL